MNKRVAVIPFPDIKNAYVVISGRASDSPNKVSSHMSFFYVSEDGDVGAEWEPNYGPITVIYKCGKDHPKAEQHWYFDFITGHGHWSQLAVNNNNLCRKFATGDYQGIFRVLEQWSQP